MDGQMEEGWREERRARILGAAARVFSRQAYEACSMDEIAQVAHVGKPTLYRYFPSKDALFAAVFSAALDALEDRLATVMRTTNGIQAQLDGLLVEIIPTFRDHLVSLRFLGENAAVADQSKRRIFRERRARIGGYLAAALDRGMRSGELRSLDAPIVAQMLIGMIWSATAASDRTNAEIAHDICTIVLRGLLGTAGHILENGREQMGWRAADEPRRATA